ncbi:MAG: non-ribosomal peptide synthetase, partial [Actinobacteria bacterium]|nr:non-ribosomal peptide synthetase [Actinomycetota bacterium]
MTSTASSAAATDSGGGEVAPLALDDAYPLTALQSGMLYHSELATETATYHDIFTLTLQADYDVAALRGALDEVSARHPVLRTSFNLTDFSEPLQLVHTSAPAPLAEFDLSDLAPEQARELLLAWREAEKYHHFDWTVAPLLRVFTHQLPAGRFALTFSFHHAILDGWSVATLTTEVLGRYAARLAGRPEPVTAVPVSYRDFVATEKAALAAAESIEFWQSQLADAPDPALPRTPGAAPVQDSVSEDIAVRYFEVTPELATSLTAVARRLGVPLRTVLLAAHLRVLGLLTGEPDVTTGVVSHNRPEHEAGAQVLGLFLNAIPVRVPVDRSSWAELVRAVFEAELAILPHRAFPLFEIQRVTGRTLLFEALFDYRDFHVYGNLPDDGPVRIVQQEFFEQTNVPFAAAFSRAPSGEGLLLTLTYQLQRFTDAAVDRAGALYLRALELLAA